jgi:DNA invertase Pin-like site-specific DNA recombinase
MVLVMAKTVFYVRVSTRDQNPALQVAAAHRLGVKTNDILIEKASGIRGDRPVLAQALAACKKGDTFACWKLDRVGRSVQHLSNFVAELEGRGVHFKTADGTADTTTTNGRLLLNILAAVAQFERDLIIERTRAGLAAARGRGKRLGPPLKWKADMVSKARALMANGDLNAEEVARTLKVSRRTLFRGLRAAREHDELIAE